MTRTAIRHTLSALAALALAFAFAAGAVAAQHHEMLHHQFTHLHGVPKTPEGLATKQDGTARDATERELMDALQSSFRNLR